MKKTLLILYVLAFTVSVNSCKFITSSDDYYGLSIKDNNNVFIIDISGSMEGKVETDLQGAVVAQATSVAADAVGDAIGGVAGNVFSSQAKKELTKLGEVKRELIPVIKGLSENSYFNIITFENDVKLWKNELVPASSTNKNLAVLMIENLSSGGGTNFYGGLEEAFKLAGPGSLDSNKLLKVDAIFMLSDGAPSTGKITSTQKILEEIKKMNPLKKVKVNAIGLGKDKDADFMEKLATQNSGQYIDK